ncbi:hypothetical protein HJB81_20725 [Rhizobium sp. NZLR1]|nr:hypothetical protein [Rhizobium sp. NZLR4b]MBX5174036.1 hypothetical protein [Rhizobium sp. NZLR1b]MBX5198244.1 hypothetical protein [Rhizobium sp. NZLR10]MBX5203794.1 hypothetical protein [Rhizobium sp. NZLR1]MBX5209458.1 hypothetical protein [Rhizobium sp. NZLR11]
MSDASIVKTTRLEADSTSFTAKRWMMSPSLQAGDAVVIDNLPTHKAAGMRDAIERVGAYPMVLPPGSPYFNTIENTFPTLETMMRARPNKRAMLYAGDSGSS